MKLIVTALATLLTILGAGIATAADPGPYYVALGDSRAAAPTWTSVLGGDNCGRDGAAYPVRLAIDLGITYRSVACISATTTNVLEGQQLTTAIPPQVDALAADTQLVTLSIGGNDIGWSELIRPCFPAGGGDGKCRTNTAMQTAIAAQLATLPGKVEAVLDEIHERSPNARVMLVGHGGYFGAGGCAFDSTLHANDAPTVAAFFAQFNAALQSAATAGDAEYVDIAGPAVGHDVCSGANNRWFIGDWPRGGTQFRHPTPLGSQAMADLIAAALV